MVRVCWVLENELPFLGVNAFRFSPGKSDLTPGEGMGWVFDPENSLRAKEEIRRAIGQFMTEICLEVGRPREVAWSR